jgi:steroid delta-isomerase-like uncharacterized protein
MTTTAVTTTHVLEPLGLSADELVDAVPQMSADLAASLADGTQVATLQTWARAWLRTWNGHDLEGVLALVTDDFVYEDPSMLGDHIVGKAQFRAFLQAIWRAFPDLTFDIPTTPYVALVGSGLAVPWRTTGTFTGDFRGGPSPLALAPTGRGFDLRGVDLYEYRDGLLSRWVSVVDSMDLARQLGLVPNKHSRLFPLMILSERLAAPLLRAVGRRAGQSSILQ